MLELNPPHGGTLVDLQTSPERFQEIKKELPELPSWDLSERQAADLELLVTGGFSPLSGFMTKADYEGVLNDMRLAGGTLWPMPICLDVTEAAAENVDVGDRLVLRDPEGVPLGLLHIEDKWTPDLEVEAEKVYGTTDRSHAGVGMLFDETNPVYLGGRVEGLERPQHHSFKHLRHTPAEIRAMFEKWGWDRVVAFQTRNPMHRAHFEVSLDAARRVEANLLLHPVVGPTKEGDVDYYTRVRCYEALRKYYPQQSTAISLLPLAMRMAGPREAVWHAIIRKNHGCTHFIVGRDHAGPGKGSDGQDFYGPYEAQELLETHADEVGIEAVTFEFMVYVEDRAEYMVQSEVPEGANVLHLSGTELRRRLKEGLPIPRWFSFPEVIQELRRAYPERSSQGFTVFFTGLPSSGKSTLAKAVVAKLNEIGDRPVTLLDGDIVRKHLSSELGFSKEHRDLNIVRIGYVASEITKNRGVAVCAPIAPYARTRQEVRSMIEEYGGFILVHVATPLEVCERRDRKGLYAMARAGKIKDFTGISDPYEEPEDADVVIDTTEMTPEEGAQRVFLHLEREGYVL